jgi:hypothetical protein
MKNLPGQNNTKPVAELTEARDVAVAGLGTEVIDVIAPRAPTTDSHFISRINRTENPSFL